MQDTMKYQSYGDQLKILYEKQLQKMLTQYTDKLKSIDANTQKVQYGEHVLKHMENTIEELMNQKNEIETELDEKLEMIQELEMEIEDFTNNVQQNMIKICDHEDILNGEIKKVQMQYDMKI